MNHPIRSISAPDPNPVKPRFAMLPGACDAHCHIFGPAEKFPYAPERRYTPPDAPRERLRALHDHLGIERAVLVQASCHGADNRAMLDAIAWSGGAWRGVAMVGPQVDERELESLHKGGVRAVRFNFVQHLGGAPDPAVADRFLETIQAAGNQPAFIHCASGNRAAAMWLIKRVLIDKWELDKATEEAAQLGLTSAPLKKFALDYVEAHKK